MNYKHGLLVAITSLLFLGNLFTVSASYKMDEFNGNYTINGTYKEDGNLITMNSDMIVNISIVGDIATINLQFDFFEYINTSLPYDVNSSYFLLSLEEVSNKLKDGVTLEQVPHNDLFSIFFGYYKVKAIFQQGDMKITCIWEQYSGILFQMDIEKTDELYAKLTITYASSDYDLFQNYPDEYVIVLQTVQFLTSPAGLIILGGTFFIIFLTTIIGIEKKQLAKSRSSKTRYKGRIK